MARLKAYNIKMNVSHKEIYPHLERCEAKYFHIFTVGAILYAPLHIVFNAARVFLHGRIFLHRVTKSLLSYFHCESFTLYWLCYV